MPGATRRSRAARTEHSRLRIQAGRGWGSRPLDETIHHLLLAGFLEGDRELVAVDLDDVAVAEFLVKHAVIQVEFRGGAGGFRDQLAFDDQGRALVARETLA